MALFMQSFAASKASKLAELEGMQLAGKQNRVGRTNIADMPQLDFDESQARAASDACTAPIYIRF